MIDVGEPFASLYDDRAHGQGGHRNDTCREQDEGTQSTMVAVLDIDRRISQAAVIETGFCG